MPQHRKPYSASRSRRTSRQVHDSTIGTHVARHGVRQSQTRMHNQALVRRARLRRVAVGVAAVAVVAALAIGAGFLAFRGVVGSELTLIDSDARDSLVSVKSDEPSYTVVTAELGAVAQPLESDGPDAILLVRFDPQSRSVALVNVPSKLQVTLDNQSTSIGSIAAGSDSSLIGALSALVKVDISHIVRISSEEDVEGLVDALGGVEVEVKQAIDDPHAGSVCIKQGRQVLDGKAALTFLRATNLEDGAEGRLVNQLDFAAQVFSNVFSSEDDLPARVDSIARFIQTDCSLGDIEEVGSWLDGLEPSGISTTVLPGYYATVTNVTGSDDERYVSTSSEVAELVEKLDGGEPMTAGRMGASSLASPSSFTVEIQNGTNVEGAAASVASKLKSDGFKVGEVGNAESPIYDETIVVYKSEDGMGLARANAVIKELGLGRAVDGSAYYSFQSDVLLIIGADNKPVS